MTGQTIVSVRDVGHPARLREEADDYPHVVRRLGDRWRVIACRDDIQWILQKQIGRDAGEKRWRGERYHRTLSGLKSSLAALGVDPPVVAGLPEQFHSTARGPT